MSCKNHFSVWSCVGKIVLFQCLVSTSAHAQEQCESVLKYAGMDESIVTSEIQRIRKFVNDFCSSSDSAQNAYRDSSQGLNIGFKGFSLGGSSDSSSSQLSQIKNSMCSNQTNVTSDLEKYHREDRRATRESITAWENCMNRSGLAARATISSERTVIVTMAYRPITNGDMAQVFKPYDAESNKRCDYIGDPALATQDSFNIGPAAVNFVCRRNTPSDRMTIVLSANTAFVNGTNPVIQVDPYNPRIEIPVPVTTATANALTISRMEGRFCSSSSIPGKGLEHRKLTCRTANSSSAACVETGSPNANHPVLTESLANDPTYFPFIPSPNYEVQGPFYRELITIEPSTNSVNADGSLIGRFIFSHHFPPGVYGVRVAALNNNDFQFTEFVDGPSGGKSTTPFPPSTWHKCN